MMVLGALAHDVARRGDSEKAASNALKRQTKKLLLLGSDPRGHDCQGSYETRRLGTSWPGRGCRPQYWQLTLRKRETPDWSITCHAVGTDVLPLLGVVSVIRGKDSARGMYRYGITFVVSVRQVVPTVSNRDRNRFGKTDIRG